MGLFTKENEQEDLEIANHQPEENEKTEAIKTKLSYHPDWEVPIQEKYVYQYHHQKLPHLKPNQISISGINLYDSDDSFVIVAFLRSTLSKPISFDVIDLIVTDEKNEPVARKSFEMDLFGQLPPITARPWNFLFEKEDMLVEELPKDWKLAFELKQRTNTTLQLDLEESWKKSLSDEQIVQLQRTVQGLPPLKPNEVNFTGIQVQKNDTNQDLAVTLLIRNGSDKKISLEQLPLLLEDASGEIVSRGQFQLNGFEVKPFTCKPWTFIFPAHMVEKENFDLSTWKVYVPTNNQVEVNQ